MSLENREELLSRALVKLKELRGTIDELERGRREPIAIIGMGCRFPGAGSPAAFWRVLDQGLDLVREVPADRWNMSQFHDSDPAAPGRSYSRHGGFLEDIDQFDARFFGISPREATSMDPQQRLLLETAWEALEDAGLPPDRLRGSRTAVYAGIGGADYAQLNLRSGAGARIDAYAGTGNLPCVAAGRIAFTLGLQGPTCVVDTGCSSSLVAVHLACRSLRAGECDAALAAGVNLMITPEMTVFLCNAKALSPSGRCRTFDASADGYVRAEGCGVLVLKRLRDAERDGDRIHAVIRGSAINHDGASSGLTVPNGVAQQEVIRAALADGGVDGGAIDYVEAHGTGTALGDPIEVQALGEVLGDGRPAGQPVYIGSLKTNFGHLEPVAGIAGLMKLVLSMQNGRIPAHLHFTEPSPRIAWDRLPVAVAADKRAWPEREGGRLAGVSSFGISGTNAHVIVQEYAGAGGAREEEQAAERDRVVLLSARSSGALRDLAAAYTELLAQPGAPKPADVAFSAAVKRSHHTHRLAVAGRSGGDFVGGLRAFLRGETSNRYSTGVFQPGAPNKLVFVFPGQGSQWIGMGRGLMAEPAFRDSLQRCDEAMRPITGWSLLSELDKEDGLKTIDVIQPAIFAMQVALSALWRSWGVEPDAVAGQSMGEIAAAHVAGALTLEDAAKIICGRSRILTQVAGKGAMALTDLSLEDARRALAGYESELSVAANTGPRATVISGDPRALDRFLEMLRARDVFCRPIKVDVASHSPQMDVLRPQLRSVLNGIAPRTAEIPFYSTVTNALCDGRELDADYWVRNLRDPVLLSSAIEALKDEGHLAFVEVSPHPVLLPSIESLVVMGPAAGGQRSGVALPSTRRDSDERAVMVETLAQLYSFGCAIEWEKFFAGSGKYVPLPLYPWQRERYWMPAAPKADAPRAHWLLGRRLNTTLDAAVYENEFTAEDPAFLGDHVIQGSAVAPGAGHVASVLCVAKQPGSALENVEFQRALVLNPDETRTVHVTAEPGRARPARFRVSSMAAPADSLEEPVWTCHATGTLSTARGPAGLIDARELLDGVRARGAEHQTGERFYRDFRDAGYNLGPSFRWIRELWRRDGEVLARLERPDAIREAEPTPLHPTLIDACFQAGCAVIEGGIPFIVSTGDVYVPFTLERFHFQGNPGAALWCHATLHEAPDPGREIIAVDLNVFADGGTRIAAVEGLCLKRARDRALLGADPLAGWMHEVVWQTQEQPEPAFDARTWIIAGNLEPLASTLETRLAERGIRASRVSETADPPSAAGGAIFLGSDCGQLLSLVRGLLSDSARTPCLRIVTRKAYTTGAADGLPDLEYAPIAGLANVIAQEHPELRVAVVDVDTDECTASLMNTLLSESPESRVALRAERRFVARLQLAAPPQAAAVRFPGDASYLITGGLGALGLATAGWMVDNGARALILIGRSRPSDTARSAIRRMEEAGAAIHVVQADASDRDALFAAYRNAAEGLPPLKGVIHAAGVLDDATILQLTPEHFQTVMRPKVDGAWNLHLLTRDEQLDCFVLFSSAASVLGVPGQGNYAAANAYMDALAHWRRAQGLPALSINWGPWAEVGLAAAQARRGERLAVRGLAGIPTEKGLEALGRLLSNGSAPQAGMFALDAGQWKQFYGEGAATFLERISTAARASASAAEGSILAALNAAPPAKRSSLLRAHVREQIALVLRASPATLDAETPLGTVGLDSLMALEIRNRLEKSLELQLSATLVWRYPTVARLAGFLESRLDPVAVVEATPAAPRFLQAAAGVGSEPDIQPEALRALSEDEMAELLARELQSIQEPAK